MFDIKPNGRGRRQRDVVSDGQLLLTGVVSSTGMERTGAAQFLPLIALLFGRTEDLQSIARGHCTFIHAVADSLRVGPPIN